MWATLQQKACISSIGLEIENLGTDRIFCDLPQSHSNFWQLWEQYQNYFYHRCLKWMGGNIHDAEDLLSRAMLKAWNQWSDYAGKIANPKAWLSRLIHNLSVDLHRQRQRESQIKQDTTINSQLEFPDSELLRRELGAYLRYKIECLPPRLRDPFILRCCLQKSYREIAQQLALSEDNVWKRVKQAQSILKKQVKKYLAGEDQTALDSPSLKNVTSTHLSQAILLSCQEKLHHLETLYTKSPDSQANFVTEKGEIYNLKLLSNLDASLLTESIIEEINYQVTGICLESLSHTWYSSPSPLEWH
ncbi:RNA polymerase sigma factor [Tolypothrix sp. PCC 7910]|uniref:RNA polymerase sigma factor n=1 Tax=Tolypothrix sp. PCC 7910 TaxID=2099387 RepID=UPI0014277DBD|nr:RNA polymerase sigma factor [Tolypothrix sp. PCC 7910]QIR36551.1 RNA polymerase sigma factor [Tolypothrix sp. PCC 7910]